MNRVLILRLGRLTDDADGDCSLPVRIRTQTGTTIDHGTLSTTRPRSFQFPDELQIEDASSAGVEASRSEWRWVVVDVITRHGAVVSHRLPLIGWTTQHTINLLPEDTPDWLMWAAADVNLAPQARISFGDTPAYHVTGRLWARRLGKWRPVELAVDRIQAKDYAKQFELTTNDPSVLQLSGPDIPSRCVSLPRGRVKMLLTANAATSADGDPLHIVISRLPAGPRDILLSLLSANDSGHISGVMDDLGTGFDWAGVGEDPLSACALGYAAIKVRALDRFALADARSLFDKFRGSSDAAILFASRAVAEYTPAYLQVLRLLSVGIDAGLPVLAESLYAANTVLDCLRRRSIRVDRKALAALSDKAWRYSDAKTGAGRFMCFYGSAPDVPGIQQAVQGRERQVANGFKNAFTTSGSAFKPVASTTLICADRNVGSPRYAPSGTT